MIRLSVRAFQLGNVDLSNEAWMKAGQRKALCKEFQRPREQADIQRKALRRGKNLAFSEDTRSEIEKVCSNVARKVNRKRLNISMKVIYQKERSPTFARIDSKTSAL